MASFQKISSSSLGEYDILYLNRQAIYQYHPRIDSYLSIRLGKKFEGVFARPNLIVEQTTKKVITWSIFKTDEEAIQWKDAAAATIQKAKEQLNILQNFIQQLQQSDKEDDKEWGTLLGSCVENVQEENLYIYDNNLVITGWGVKPISIFKKISPISANIFDENEEDANDNIDNITQNTEENNNINDFSNDEIENQDDVTEDTSIISEESLDNYIDNTENQSDIVDEIDNEYDEKSEQIVDNKEVDNDNNFSNNNDTFSQDNNKYENTSSSNDENQLNKESESNNNNLNDKEPPKKYNWFNNFFRSNKLWWIFLLILLFLIILFWKGCNRGNTYLPPNPSVIIPIDTNVIVPDDDSLRMIVADRLNIILKDKNQEISDFAKAFKKEYGNKEYEIIYFDTSTNRIQIQIPAKEREQLLKEIPKKLSNFEMLIWHESIFERNVTPNDPAFSDATKAWYFDAIKVEQAWDKSYGDKKLIVAIIDDGFDLQHKELSGNIVKPWNVVSRSRNVFTNRKAQHGSHVAGTAIGNRENGSGLAGIAPDCKLMPIQVADANGTISTTAIVDAVLYAINQGADVINLSLGMKIDPKVAKYPIGVQKDIIKNSFLPEQYFWEDILEIAEEEDIVIVMAGGNDNVLIGLDPMQRSPLALKVSAVGHNLGKAAFSNYGEMSTLSAPGVGIYSSIPSNRYAYMDGTSMAAPIVTGAVALVKSINPTLKANEVRNLLINTARPLTPNIGPLLQLGVAIDNIDDETIISNPGAVDCDKIQSKIDSLMEEVEKLKRLCSGGIGQIDTMKMPDVIEDLDFTLGRWKSTTSIHNDDNEKVTLYFDFYKNRQGTLTLVEPNGLNCTADLSLNKNKQQFKVNQKQDAQCKGTPKTYQDYTFSCQADVNGYAECTAQNKTIKANKFKFKLIKIR